MRPSSDVIAAYTGAWRRVLSAPSLIAGVWLLTVAAAVPPAIGVAAEIADHLGESAAAVSVASGLDRWSGMEFASRARGAASTLTPEVIGFAAVLSNVSSVLDGTGVPPAVLVPVAVYALLWLLVLGGLLDRLARGRRVGARHFFGACGAFAARLVRLWAVMLPAWAAVGGLWWLLFIRALPALTRDVTAEHVAFAWLVVFWAVGLVPVALVLVLVDYARVRLVVEDRRSVLGAVLAAARFLRRNAPAAAALFSLNFATWLAVVVAYGLLAPGARGDAWQVAAALGIGQAYIVLRLIVRLVALASVTALFQSRLAHAGYTAAPVPVWPDSAAAEAITNLGNRGMGE